MKILVLVKQVPDLEGYLQPTDGWIDERNLAFRLNEYDEYAVEQAILVKESQGGEPDVTVLCLGPGRVTEALKKALAMGADRAVHLVDETPQSRDSWQVASAVHAFARDKGYDLILTGYQSQDRGSAQVGPLLAELLELPSLSTVVGFELAEGQVTVKRELEGGTKAVVRAALPAVITAQLGLNSPRYPTLPNIMKAKKKELLSLPAADFLPGEGRLENLGLFRPDKKGGGVVLEGEATEVAEKLAAVLKEKKP
jgi:electron transfer flavoprotein beta subunit